MVVPTLQTHLSSNEHLTDAEIHQRNQIRLKAIMTLPGNQRCCDCSDARPTWAILIVPPPSGTKCVPNNCPMIGAFACYQCSALHRTLGWHICYVKSCTGDYWNDSEVLAMERGGNVRTNNIFEGKTIYNCTKPTATAETITKMEFIREKYESRTFVDGSKYSACMIMSRQEDGNNSCCDLSSIWSNEFSAYADESFASYSVTGNNNTAITPKLRLVRGKDGIVLPSSPASGYRNDDGELSDMFEDSSTTVQDLFSSIDQQRLDKARKSFASVGCKCVVWDPLKESVHNLDNKKIEMSDNSSRTDSTTTTTTTTSSSEIVDAKEDTKMHLMARWAKQGKHMSPRHNRRSWSSLQDLGIKESFEESHDAESDDQSRGRDRLHELYGDVQPIPPCRSCVNTPPDSRPSRRRSMEKPPLSPFCKSLDSITSPRFQSMRNIPSSPPEDVQKPRSLRDIVNPSSPPSSSAKGRRRGSLDRNTLANMSTNSSEAPNGTIANAKEVNGNELSCNREGNSSRRRRRNSTSASSTTAQRRGSDSASSSSNRRSRSNSCSSSRSASASRRRNSLNGKSSRRRSGSHRSRPRSSSPPHSRRSNEKPSSYSSSKASSRNQLRRQKRLSMGEQSFPASQNSRTISAVQRKCQSARPSSDEKRTLNNNERAALVKKLSKLDLPLTI